MKKFEEDLNLADFACAAMKSWMRLKSKAAAAAEKAVNPPSESQFFCLCAEKWSIKQPAVSFCARKEKISRLFQFISGIVRDKQRTLNERESEKPRA